MLAKTTRNRMSVLTQVERALLLDVVIRQGSPVLQLLAREDEPLLVWRDTFLVLDLRLHVVDGVGRLHLKGDRLASQRLHENLHPSTQTEDEMKSRFLLDIVVRQRAAVLQLLASKDESLLVGWNALLVLNLRLDVINGVRGLHLQGDGLARQCLDEDLHPSTETKD